MESLIPVVHKLVNEYLSAHPEVDIYRPADHEKIAADISRRANLPDNLALVLIVTVCLLGPPKPAPPVKLVRQLGDILSRHIEAEDEQKQRLLEFAVAFGVGSWRRIDRNAHGWHARWAGAMRVMAFKLKSGVDQMARLLLWIHNIKLEENNLLIAHRLAMVLVEPEKYRIMVAPGEKLTIRPVTEGLEITTSSSNSWFVEIPPGAKLVITLHGEGVFFEHAGQMEPVEEGSRVVIASHDDIYEVRLPRKYRLSRSKNARFVVNGPGMELDIWRCACGSDKCGDRHRLTAWNPSKRINLWRFLAVAVKGLGPDDDFRPGVFGQSMLYALLCNKGFAVYGPNHQYWQVRLRLGPVVFKQCDRHSLFTGHKCSRCGQQFDPGTMKRVKKEVLFLEGDGQLFMRKPFARCKQCQNLVEVTDSDVVKEALCHICGAPFIGKAALRRLLEKNRTNITRRKALYRARLRLKNCKSCKGPIKVSNWRCPFCGIFDFGQNQVHAWHFSPELGQVHMIRAAGGPE